MGENMQFEIVTENLAFPEGPVVCDDGSVLVVEIAAGRITRITKDGRHHLISALGGGPNGAAVGPDGALYVCNNGGLSRESRSVPGIQRVDPDTGEVEVLYTECDGRPLTAPNDLVFDQTGCFWFTDYVGGAIFYADPQGTSIKTAV